MFLLRSHLSNHLQTMGNKQIGLLMFLEGVCHFCVSLLFRHIFRCRKSSKDLAYDCRKMTVFRSSFLRICPAIRSYLEALFISVFTSVGLMVVTSGRVRQIEYSMVFYHQLNITYHQALTTPTASSLEY